MIGLLLNWNEQMKLTEITDNEDKPGTYAGVRFGANTLATVERFIEEHEIPNALEVKDFHSTLLFSRKHLPNYKPKGKYDVPLEGVFTEFDVWESQADDDGTNPNV